MNTTLKVSASHIEYMMLDVLGSIHVVVSNINKTAYDLCCSILINYTLHLL